MSVFVYILHRGKRTLLSFHVRLSGHLPLCSPEIALIAKQNQPVLLLSVLSRLLVFDTAVGPGEREISRASDVTAQACGEMLYLG